jgi:hypothetical protein
MDVRPGAAFAHFATDFYAVQPGDVALEGSWVCYDDRQVHVIVPSCEKTNVILDWSAQ